MDSGTTIQEGRRKAKRVAAWPFDVNNLRAEFAELCTDIWLCDEDASADDTNAFERSEFGDQRWRCGPLKALDPVRHILAKLFYLILVFEKSRVVRHFSAPIKHSLDFSDDYDAPSLILAPKSTF
jgi:hypothetical protein